MTIVQLEYLLALNQYRNYSKAAIECNVTQPTLSMQLRKLEEGFGEPLIKHGKTPVEFTLLGKNVIQQAKIVLQEFQNLSYIQNQSNKNFQLQLSIGIIPTIAPYLVPKLAQKLNEKFKNVMFNFIELKTDELIEAVGEMDVDYGIMSGPYDGHLKVQELYLEPIRVYTKASDKKVHLEKLTDENAWFLSKGNCFRMQMIRLCDNLNKSEESSLNFEGDSLGTLINMVDTVGGYTMVPEHYLQFVLHDKNKVKQIRGLNPVRSIIGISRKRNAKSDYLTGIDKLVAEEYKRKTEKPFIVDWR